MKYIDAEKLKTWLENEADMEFKKTEENVNSPVLCHFHNGCRMQALDTIDFITSLQQEQLETDIKSPFTGGKIAILSREEEVTFRGEKVKILRKYYRCEDTGKEFTDSKLDDDMMWDTFRAYCKKKGMTSFTDIVLKQEQQKVDLEKEIARFALNGGTGDNTPTIGETARYFYGLRNRALEEAAQHVYESWNGGTMDDVRRDIVELGKVLNARKK